MGRPTELKIVREALTGTAAARVERATLNREALLCAQGAAVGSVVCVETHVEEQTHPWVLGVVTEAYHSAPSSSKPHDVSSDPIQFTPFKAGDPVLKLQLYEALAPGSATFFLSEAIELVSARQVRVVGVELEEARSARGSSQRMKLVESSLAAIHAEMPTLNEQWEVESTVQHRMLYGVDQWLVKWKGFGEDKNTWEPWENLLTAAVRDEATKLKMLSLPRTAAGLNKLTVPTLRDALLTRGLDPSGLKSELLARLLSYFANACD